MKIELISGNDALGESPLWLADEDTLCWTDVSACQLHALAFKTRERASWQFERPLGAIARAAAGRLVLVFRSTIAVLERDSGTLTQLVKSPGDERFNDAKCDRQGRLWVGTFDRKMERPIGALYCLDSGQLKRVDSGFQLSNGIAWSPDDTVMYFTDTHARRIYAYDYDVAAGQVTNRRVFAAFDVGPGRPDGCTVDAEGCLWTALAGGSVVVRVSPEGSVLSRIELPVQHPTSCTFGGNGWSTLFITSMRDHRRAIEPASEIQLAGSLFAVTDLGASGIADAEYAIG